MKHIKKLFNKLTIKQAILISTIFLAVVPLMFSDLVLIRFTEKNLLENQSESQEVLSSLLAAQSKQFIQIVESKVESVKTSILFNSVGSTIEENLDLMENRKTLTTFLENAPEIEYILIQSDKGRKTFALNTSYEIQQILDGQIQPLIASCMHENREIKSDPVFIRNLLKVYLFFLYPIDTPEGRAVIATAVNVDKLFQSIKTKLPEGYSFFIVDNKGSIIATDNKTRMGYKFHDNISSIISRKTTTAYFNDRESLVYGASVPQMASTIITLIPVEQAHQHINDMKYQTIFFGLVGMLLAIIVSIAISAAIHEPLSVLMAHTEKIAKKNFSIRVELEGNVEVNLLAGRINFMLEEIENYIKRLQHLVRYNKKLFFSIISALAAAIDAKDEYTKGHSDRVTKYAIIIGKYLELNRVELERLKIAGLLHDIGKIGIDDRVLRKPGILTDEEFEHMKLHPVIGHTIITPIKELKEISDGVRFHHEKWDGTGYPEGLKEDEIPLFARIIAIADTFDAMTTNRPYQEAMDPDFVVEKMKGFSSSRYDKRVVNAFLKAYKDGQITVETVESK